MSESAVLYEKLIHENMDKGFQIKLVVNEFRDVLYFHLRKYFLSYEGEWIPSREGISIPAELDNIYNLLDGLLDVCSQAEGVEIINEYYMRVNSEQTRTVLESS